LLGAGVISILRRRTYMTRTFLVITIVMTTLVAGISFQLVGISSQLKEIGNAMNDWRKHL
jgi:hypothetical protein